VTCSTVFHNVRRWNLRATKIASRSRTCLPSLQLCTSRGAGMPDLTVTCGAVTDNPCAGLQICVCPAGGSYQQPILCLVGNLSASGGARDATRLLLTWREFRTLLHEMGHAVHSLVSRTRYQHVWGTRYAGQSQICSQAGQPYSTVGPLCGVRSCAELMLYLAVLSYADNVQHDSARRQSMFSSAEDILTICCPQVFLRLLRRCRHNCLCGSTLVPASPQ
jgi:hypothetical protein